MVTTFSQRTWSPGLNRSSAKSMQRLLLLGHPSLPGGVGSESKTKPSTSLGNPPLAPITCSEWPYTDLILFKFWKHKRPGRNKMMQQGGNMFTAEANYTLSTSCPDRAIVQPTENQHLHNTATPSHGKRAVAMVSPHQSICLKAFWCQISLILNYTL